MKTRRIISRRRGLALAGTAILAGCFFPATAWAQDERVERGYRAYRAGNLTEAEAVFRQVCAEYEAANASWGWCHLILGTVLGQPGQDPSKRREALAQLEIAKELVTTDGERFEVLSAIANVHLLGRDWRTAVSAADAAAPFASDEQRGLLAKIRGQAHYQARDFAAAVPDLEAAVRARPNEATLHAFLGHARFETGARGAALDDLTEALRLDADNPIGLFFAARINIENGDYDDAVRIAERALQAHPQDIGLRILMGSAYLGADRYTEAVEQFEIVVAQRPEDGTAIYNLGRAYTGLEDWPRAVEQYQAAQGLLPPGSATLASLLFDLGSALETLGRYEDALAAYNDSVAIADDIKKQDALERVREHIHRKKVKVGSP